MMNSLAQNENRFAIGLYGSLRDKPGNLFFSSYSIATALEMAYAGSRGETAEQMASVLHLDGEAYDPLRVPDPIEVGEADLGFRLNVANRLWGREGSHFLPEYLELTKSRFGAELALVDFSEAERARKAINSWIDRRTLGKIKDLIRPGDLNAATRLVLTNAIYFKGEWSSPFDGLLTKDDTFLVTIRREVRAPMMHRKADLPFFAGGGLKVLELPYGNGELAMDIVLPDQVEGMSSLEGMLSAGKLAGWLDGLKKREVEVSLPRFRITSRFDLAAVLKAMGMDRAFTPGQADFSGISTEDELVISGAIYQAFVEVNEDGTEAAAATAVAMRTLAVMAPRPTTVFRADHPFLYLIRDVRSGSILFLGRVADPTA